MQNFIHKSDQYHGHWIYGKYLSGNYPRGPSRRKILYEISKSHEITTKHQDAKNQNMLASSLDGSAAEAVAYKSAAPFRVLGVSNPHTALSGFARLKSQP